MPEKIYQRQVTKLALSDCKSSSSFEMFNELKKSIGSSSDWISKDFSVYRLYVSHISLIQGTTNSKSDSFTRKDVCAPCLTVLCGEADDQ